jgi:hypothetical protein
VATEPRRDTQAPDRGGSERSPWLVDKLPDPLQAKTVKKRCLFRTDAKSRDGQLGQCLRFAAFRNAPAPTVMRKRPGGTRCRGDSAAGVKPLCGKPMQAIR